MAYSTIEFKNTKLPYLGQDGVRMNLANEPALNYRGQASGSHGWFWVTVPDEDTAHWLMDQGVNVKDYTRIDRDSGEPVTSYRVKVQVNLQALFNGPIIHQSRQSFDGDCKQWWYRKCVLCMQSL